MTHVILYLGKIFKFDECYSNHRIKQTVTFVFQNYFKFYQLFTVQRTQSTTNEHGVT